jgi:hypothetical protein
MSAPVEQLLAAIEAAIEDRDDIPASVVEQLRVDVAQATTHLHLALDHADRAVMRLARLDRDPRLPGFPLLAELN